MVTTRHYFCCAQRDSSHEFQAKRIVDFNNIASDGPLGPSLPSMPSPSSPGTTSAAHRGTHRTSAMPTTVHEGRIMDFY
ncbi:unnamed protein product [Closterium sp. Naga37s-1]|nr:unnamed protein product [Closterium sp. Naga37s-1]